MACRKASQYEGPNTKVFFFIRNIGPNAPFLLNLQTACPLLEQQIRL